MKKALAFLFALSCAIWSFNVLAEPIESFPLMGMHSRHVNLYSLNSHAVYAVSCTSDFVDFLKASSDDMDKLSLQVNPGEVTDRHGRHGVTPSYDFPAPVGTAYFFAEPDATGSIDFAVVNTTQQSFYIFCNINQQDIKL